MALSSAWFSEEIDDCGEAAMFATTVTDYDEYKTGGRAERVEYGGNEVSFLCISWKVCI